MSDDSSPLVQLVTSTVSDNGAIRPAGLADLEQVLCSTEPDEQALALFEVTKFIGFLIDKGHTGAAEELIVMCSEFAGDVEAFAEDVEDDLRARSAAGSKMMDAAVQDSQVATGNNETAGPADAEGMRSVLDRLKQQSAARKQKD